MVPPLRATGQTEPKDEAKPSAGLDGCKPGCPASGIRAQTQSSPSRRIRTTLSRAMGNWYSASAGPNDANAGRAPAASKTAANTTPQGSIATSRRKNTPQTRRSRSKIASLRQPRSSARAGRRASRHAAGTPASKQCVVREDALPERQSRSSASCGALRYQSVNLTRTAAGSSRTTTRSGSHAFRNNCPFSAEVR